MEEADCPDMESPQEGEAVPPQATAHHRHLEARGCQDMEVAVAQEDPHQLVLTMELLRLLPYQVMEAQVRLLLLVTVHHQVVAQPPQDTVLLLLAVQPLLVMVLLVQPPQGTQQAESAYSADECSVCTESYRLK